MASSESLHLLHSRIKLSAKSHGGRKKVPLTCQEGREMKVKHHERFAFLIFLINIFFDEGRSCRRWKPDEHVVEEHSSYLMIATTRDEEDLLPKSKAIRWK